MLSPICPRVCFATHLAAFDPPGGGERQLLEYRSYLMKAGLDVTLFNLWHPTINDHDLFHIFSTAAGTEHFCHHLNRSDNKPLVVSPNLWITPQSVSEYPAQAIRMSLVSARKVICNSEVERGQLAEALHLDPVLFSVIYNGIGDSFWPWQRNHSFSNHYSISGPYVLNVANIEPRKNQLRLIQALRKWPELTLVIAGHIRDREYAKACFEAGGNRINFVGPLEHGSNLMLSAYSECEVFALPSLLETPGLSALEALACGAKVVTTKVGAAPEYLGDAANYVDPLDVESIHGAISLALSQRKSLAKALYCQTNFNWSRVLSNLVPTYNAVLSNEQPAIDSKRQFPAELVDKGNGISVSQPLNVQLQPGLLSGECCPATEGHFIIETDDEVLWSSVVEKGTPIAWSFAWRECRGASPASVTFKLVPTGTMQDESFVLSNMIWEPSPESFGMQ